jgi:hypothetical protein
LPTKSTCFPGDLGLLDLIFLNKYFKDLILVASGAGDPRPEIAMIEKLLISLEARPAAAGVSSGLRTAETRLTELPFPKMVARSRVEVARIWRSSGPAGPKISRFSLKVVFLV